MTPKEAASWMKEQVETEGLLYQETAAARLLEESDESLAYWDDTGNLCIGKSVLSAFRTITPDLVYERSEKFWRPRADYDRPGRQQ